MCRYYLRHTALRTRRARRDAGRYDAQPGLIEEAWAFIRATEERKEALRGATDYLWEVRAILANNRKDCPMLAEMVLE